mgnify:CR=1 FL=1|jgi:hypothetical protein
MQNPTLVVLQGKLIFLFSYFYSSQANYHETPQERSPPQANSREFAKSEIGLKSLVPTIPIKTATEKKPRKESRSVTLMKAKNGNNTKNILNYSNLPQLGKNEFEKPGHKHLEESDIIATFVETIREPEVQADNQADPPVEDYQLPAYYQTQKNDVEISIDAGDKKVSSPVYLNKDDQENEELMEEEGEAENDETKATEHSKIRMTPFEYMRCFFSKDEKLIKKREMLKEGKKRIEERLDVFNILKKMREIDKLKALLFDQYQLALFENLPRPVLEKESREFLNNRAASISHLVKGTFIHQTKENQVKYAYKYIKHKESKTLLDQKLLNIYEELAYY